jgi:peptidylprolyl isomerase
VCVYGLKTAPPILQNLAANRSATGSAPCDPSQTPDKAFNGSASQGPADKWCSAAEHPFLQVDLGSNVSINRLVIEHAAAGGDDLLLNTRDFDIQVSSDGTNFATVENVVGNIQSITTHDIPPATARYVRLNIIVPTQIGLNTANIFDFQVFSVPANSVTEVREPAKAGSQPIRAGEDPSAPRSVSGLPSAAAKTTTAPGAERTQPKPAAKSLIPAPPDVNAPASDAQLTESRVTMKVLRPGTGIEHPAGNDCPILAFTAWKRDGTLFATSKSMGGSAVQCLSTAIMGVAETLKLMVVGEKRRIWVPADLTYVEGHHHAQKRPEDEKPPNLDLTFDLELVGVMKAPVTPTDLIASPEDAIKTPSGLAYKVLEPGTGAEHPSMKSHAKLHFSGWTSTGRLIETTVPDGQRRQSTCVDTLRACVRRETCQQA